MSTRRSFLKHSLAGSAAISLAGAMPSFLLRASQAAPPESDQPILVVVQLSGGNDGLNTVIPFGDEEYYRNRFTLAIPKSDVLKVDSTTGLHPSLQGLRELLEAGELAVVQGVGYPQPNRSHFESMDLWHTAHRLDEGRLGWLGRAVEQPGIASELPALHLGGEVQPLALRSEHRPVPSIRSIDNFRLNALRDRQVRDQIQQLLKAPRASDNTLLGYVHESAEVALQTSLRLEQVAARPTGGESRFPGSSLGRNLQAVAQLIGSGLETRIYYTSLNGFDTHSNQRDAHAGLLSDLDRSLTAFLREMESQGNADRVLVFAFSEFGRRVRENASAGTDHGTAAPVFLAGKRVAAGLIGEHPSLTDLDEGDLKFRVDYRSVYAGILTDWLKIPPALIVGPGHEPLSLFT